MIKVLGGLVCLTALLMFAYRRSLRYLHILQQEEYDVVRFLKWFTRKHAYDKRLTIGVAALIIITASFNQIVAASVFFWLLALFLFAASYLEPDPRNNAKKKLVMTDRASRIFFVGLGFTVLFAAVVAYFQMPWMYLISIHSIPLTLLLAVVLLGPFEQRVQKKYWDEAYEKLSLISPRVIGITGSFGKTSVKHILGHVLEINSRSLITPGSVNTAMGIARVVREQLENNCENFVVEMGAYGRGSIKRLCQLAPPDVGIITSIGEAHYERFKSLDAVAKAKFELAESVLSTSEGRVIVHENALQENFAATFVSKHRDRFIICGYGKDSDVQIVSYNFSKQGIDLVLSFEDKSYSLKVPLHGRNHVDNISLAFAAALNIGLPIEGVMAAMQTMPQIKHRLEVKQLQDGSTLVDDAYNSNPSGFAAALQLLPKLKTENGRTILVTPGMAELGERHASCHKELGMLAAETADLVLVINPDRIPSFIDGFKSKREETESNLLLIKSFSDADEWLAKNRRAGDVVLIENDLPDLYERPFET